MIRHIVFFTARRQEDVEAIVTGLDQLGAIGHAKRFEVARNLKTDALGSAIDVVVYAEFQDQAALDAYKADPIYEATIKVVKPLRELRFSADIVSSDEVSIR